MRAPIVLLALLARLAAASCRTVVINCTKVEVGLSFNGFEGEDLDTVLVKHYLHGTGFTNPTRTDTLAFMQRSPIYLEQDGLEAGQDYAVEIPATGTRVTIGNIQLAGHETERIRQSFGVLRKRLV